VVEEQPAAAAGLDRTAAESLHVDPAQQVYGILRDPVGD
jgi:hypothetical protein